MKKTSKSDQTQKLLNTVSSERKEKRMFILSQDKTRIFNMQGHIEGIGYEEENLRRGRKKRSDTRFRCLTDAPKKLPSTNAKKIA